MQKESYGLDYDFIGKNFVTDNNKDNASVDSQANRDMKRRIIEETKKRLRQFKLEKGRERAMATSNPKKEEIKGFSFKNQIYRNKTFSYMNE